MLANSLKETKTSRVSFFTRMYLHTYIILSIKLIKRATQWEALECTAQHDKFWAWQKTKNVKKASFHVFN